MFQPFPTTFMAAAGGGPYHADAVHLDGTTYLTTSSLTCTDNGTFSMSFWFKVASDLLDGATIGVVDPDGDFNNSFDFEHFDATLRTFRGTLKNVGRLTWSTFYTPDQWNNIILSADTNFG